MKLSRVEVEFGAAIRTACEIRNISWRELSEGTKISEQTLKHLARGEYRPLAHEFSAIWKFLTSDDPKAAIARARGERSR